MGNAAKVSGWEEEKVTNCEACGETIKYCEAWIDASKSVLVCDSCKAKYENEEYVFEGEGR